ncbi:MAG: hypothetical protein A2076_02895 [Geobacteraceae bacterium GWC2_53_11]|nr:MAG: hypothetical protein A2076_02895 [Geobacteraceae bacterium GWC2_53_11]
MLVNALITMAEEEIRPAADGVCEAVLESAVVVVKQYRFVAPGGFVVTAVAVATEVQLVAGAIVKGAVKPLLTIIATPNPISPENIERRVVKGIVEALVTPLL